MQPWSIVIVEPKKIKSVTVSIVYPSICHKVMGLNTLILVFEMLNFKPAFSLSSFTFNMRIYSSFSHSTIEVISPAYLRLLIFPLAILIPLCDSYSSAFCMTYKLNNQGNNIQPLYTCFPIVNQFIVLCPVLTVLSWLTYRFLRRWIRWSGITICMNFPPRCDLHSQSL